LTYEAIISVYADYWKGVIESDTALTIEEYLDLVNAFGRSNEYPKRKGYVEPEHY